MNKNPQYNQQTEPKHCIPEVEKICIPQKLAPSQQLSLANVYLKINSGFHAREQQYLKVVKLESYMKE